MAHDPHMARLRQWPLLTALARRWQGWRRRRGRILAVKLGYNPNSSSLGVDVTFLLFGATFASALALMLGALLRRQRAP